MSHKRSDAGIQKNKNIWTQKNLTRFQLSLKRKTLEKICRFISYFWADYWFSKQKYDEESFTNLADILKTYKKALNTLEYHWKKEPSATDIPRSNQCAERAIKVM